MANMSYCRFQNTLGDLRDCKEALDDEDDLPKEGSDEYWAMTRLVEICKEIADNNEIADYR